MENFKIPEGHGLGRMPSEDEKDKFFLMRSLLEQKEAPERTYRYWNANGWWGDQGSLPHCVGYSWTHWIEDGPITHKGPAPIINPSVLYKEAQRVDEWAGENYDGTSVRAGAKALQSRGLITNYLWAWDVNTVAQAILTTGPVVVGTNWYNQMFYPDQYGKIYIYGRSVGGHAYLLNGVNTKTRMFRIKNSWGQNWGRKGHAFISFDDMQRLIDEQGEACLAVENYTS